MADGGFKAFLMRGNVVDLAVGVVIGAAFGAVVACGDIHIKQDGKKPDVASFEECQTTGWICLERISLRERM